MDEVTVKVVKRVGRPRKYPEGTSLLEQAHLRRASLKARGYRLLGRIELSPEASSALDVLMADDKYATRAIENALLLAVKSRLA